MTYEETMQWINQIGKTGICLGLERMEALVEALEHPEKKLRIIHVAGTNGKGSVCTMISSVLEAMGYKVGRYISPTLYDYRERIQINGCYIEKEMLAKGMSLLRKTCEGICSRGGEMATIFEVETALAFWYFKEKNCDYVVLETGMGGRLDSTNVIRRPELTVITPISMDHMAQLGESLEAIAEEKAGILKQNVPAVIYPQPKGALAVLKKHCREKNISMISPDWKSLYLRKQSLFENDESFEGCQIFDYKSYKGLVIHLNGTYQVKNACLAIEAVEKLKLDAPIEKALYEGLSKARWPGRFQCLSREPLIFIDGAHNPEGAKALRLSAENYFSEKKITLVMGVFADKDYCGILREMASLSERIITFTPEDGRGLDSGLLRKAAAPFFAEALDGENAKNALEMAKKKAGAEGLIIIFGSLSTISTIYDII